MNRLFSSMSAAALPAICVLALMCGCDFSSKQQNPAEHAAARETEEAAPLKEAGARIQRSGSTLRIQPETGDPLVFEDQPYNSQTGRGYQFWTLKAAYSDPDVACLEMTGDEYLHYYLIDMKTGRQSTIDGTPVFSPDRTRFATANHPYISEAAFFKIWRLEDATPIEESSVSVRVGFNKMRQFKIKWGSPRSVTFEENIKLGEEPIVMPVTFRLVDDRWKREAN